MTWLKCKCDFCGKTEEVKSGEAIMYYCKSTHICNECVELCVQIKSGKAEKIND